MNMNSENKSTIMVLGLGNPGPAYKDTPHNVGYAVIDNLAQKYELEPKQEKSLHAEVFELRESRRLVVLAKPSTFMNRSGVAAHAISRKFKATPQRMWVVHDDVDLPLGTIRIVRRRGAAGHKGVESIIEQMRTKDFVRFRLGVRPLALAQRRPAEFMNAYVTQKFKGAFKKEADKMVSLASEAIEYSLDAGIESAMTRYNKRQEAVGSRQY